MSSKLLSVADAAELLGVHRTRINQLIASGDLPAQRIGRSYVILESDLELVKERQPPGRPPLTEEEKMKRTESGGVQMTASKTLPFDVDYNDQPAIKKKTRKSGPKTKTEKRVGKAKKSS